MCMREDPRKWVNNQLLADPEDDDDREACRKHRCRIGNGLCLL